MESDCFKNMYILWDREKFVVLSREQKKKNPEPKPNPTSP